MTDATKLPPLPEASARALSDQIEQRILTWRQRIMNKSGDRLALDDFMGKDSIDDLVDFVCDEWVIDAAIAAARAPLLAEIEALRKRAEDAERDAARYRAFFERGPVVCFDGREFVNKGECDSAIDAAIKGGAA
jgi:hypothetical protein